MYIVESSINTFEPMYSQSPSGRDKAEGFKDCRNIIDEHSLELNTPLTPEQVKKVIEDLDGFWQEYEGYKNGIDNDNLFRNPKKPYKSPTEYLKEVSG